MNPIDIILLIIQVLTLGWGVIIHVSNIRNKNQFEKLKSKLENTNHLTKQMYDKEINVYENMGIIFYEIEKCIGKDYENEFEYGGYPGTSNAIHIVKQIKLLDEVTLKNFLFIQPGINDKSKNLYNYIFEFDEFHKATNGQESFTIFYTNMLEEINEIKNDIKDYISKLIIIE